MEAIIITIGDEILNGQTIDTNSAWIASQLNLFGIQVNAILSIKDERENIHRTLTQASWFVDLIIITGGLGPTSDDITKPTLAEYFGGNLVFNPDVFANIQKVLSGKNIVTLERNRQQAEIPDNCIPLQNLVGTAPGMWFEKKGKTYISLPGVPYEMMGLMEKEVIPRLTKQFHLPKIVHRYIHTVGIGESAIAEKLVAFENALPEYIKLAYLPNLGSVKIRLSAIGNNVAVLKKEMDELVEKVDTLMPKYIFSIEENETLPESIGQLLKREKKILGTAESCTGGYIAHKITSVPGSSMWYKGSVIAYSNEIKIMELNVDADTLNKEGAVSEKVVKQMANGLISKWQVDYAIAVSGIAGPDGGTPDKPVGTVWVAVASQSVVFAKEFRFNGNRLQNIELTATVALDMLRRFLKGYLG